MDQIIGNIYVSPLVLESIVDDILKKQDKIKLFPKKGIKIEISKNNVSVNLMVKVVFGTRIPDVTWDIQKNIKESIEKFTNLNVREVNIHVYEFEFSKD